MGCPPEVREVPKMQGPFMVGSRTVEVESREKCRKEPVMIKGIRIPPNAKDGSRLSVRGQMRGKVLGHQTPGRLPGPVKLVVKRIPDLIYRVEGEDNLYTVLSISLGESLYGFKRQWQLFSDPDQVKIIRVGMVTQPGEVMRLPRKGMHNDRGGRGDLYVRIEVKYPTTSPAEGSIVPPTAAEAEEAYTVKKPELRAEDEITVSESGELMRFWDRDGKEERKRLAAAAAAQKKKGGKKTTNKEEL